MGHRNTQFIGYMIDMETDQQGHSHLHPEPCVFYGSIPNFPLPHNHSVVPAPGNQCQPNFHHLPEHHDNHALFYGMPQFNTVQSQHQGTNLDLSVGPPSCHYSRYLTPRSGIRDFPAQVDQGTYNQVSLSTNQRIVGIPMESFSRNIPYMNGVRGSFKRKNAEGAPASYQYHTASAGPSSSVAPMIVRTAESDISPMEASSYMPTEFVTNEPALIGENLRSVRNRPGMIGPETVLAHNANHFIQGNYVAPPVQLPGNPWLDMHFGANNGDVGTFAWSQTPGMPYMPAGVNGACVEAGNMGVQSYQATANNRSSGFMHPPVPQGHPGPHHPAQLGLGTGSYNGASPLQVAASSHGVPTVGSSNTGIGHFPDVESGSTFLAPGPLTGFRLYRPYRREIMLDQDTRHRNFHHLRVLPEDEVAILEIPGYHETGDSIDHHRDMRLDIDHMTYEGENLMKNKHAYDTMYQELLALGEQIGHVGTGLTEEIIRRNLKLRIFNSSAACSNLEKATSPNQQINFCVVCQADYEDEEHIGALDCGHEYHRNCIEKWLLMKNTCPVCKSTAVSGKGKNS